MYMNKSDWRAYASYLESQIKGKDLKDPSSIGEAYNNFTIIQDLSDVNKNKLNAQT